MSPDATKFSLVALACTALAASSAQANAACSASTVYSTITSTITVYPSGSTSWANASCPTTTAPGPATCSPPPPGSNSAVPGPGGSKRGIPFGHVNNTLAFSGTKVWWAYDWGQTAANLSSNFNFVPMLWGLYSHSSSGWQANAKAAIAAGSNCLLSFNEPDQKFQSNIDPVRAADGYRTNFVTPFGGGSVRLGAPAVTNGPAPLGLTWLSNFMGNCSDCQIDFVPLHWYGAASASGIEIFQKHIESAHQQTCRPIWITEFGGHGTDDDINAFLKAVLPWLDAQDYVERYAYFMAMDGLLNNGTGLSVYGSTYATL